MNFFFFDLHLIELQTSNFQFLQSGCISKIETNRFSRCCCYSVQSPQEAISWSRTLRFFLYCLSLKYVVSDHFWWGYVPVNQNDKLTMCLHFHRIRTWHMFKTPSSACTSVWAIWKLFHPVKKRLKSFLRDHWPFTTVQNR